MKLYTLFKTQDPESHLIPCAAAHTRIGQIWECPPPPPPPSRAHNVAQINKVSNEFQFRHRRPKLTLRGMGDAWHLCWMRRYAPRYRWPLKTRDFVWEIKYWDLRTLNNVKSNFRSMKWMKTTYLRCIAPCFGVCLSLYCFFLGGGLYCITTVTPFTRRSQGCSFRKQGPLYTSKLNCVSRLW